MLLSPCDVFLDAQANAVQPDIIFVSTEHLSIIKDDAIYGIPDLLIEVLSAGNSEHDLVTKKRLYEKFGVKEYWIVNPVTDETIGYSLKGQIYIECGRFARKIVSPCSAKSSFSNPAYFRSAHRNSSN